MSRSRGDLDDVDGIAEIPGIVRLVRVAQGVLPAPQGVEHALIQGFFDPMPEGYRQARQGLSWEMGHHGFDGRLDQVPKEPGRRDFGPQEVNVHVLPRIVRVWGEHYAGEHVHVYRLGAEV